MRILERQPGDIDELRRRAAAERHALRRDRYRAVLLALDGKEAPAIAEALGRARRSVVFLRMLSKELEPGEHAVLILDEAGYE